jgi:hemolysin III
MMVVGREKEEVANAVTHALGALASLAGGAGVVTVAARSDDPWLLAGTLVFSITLVMLYGASTLYHSVRHDLRKARLRVLDHCAIYLLIAGTYTPFTLDALHGAWRWTLLASVWGMALAGIVYKLFLLGRFPRLSTATYLAMGWLAVLVLPALLRALPLTTVLWLVAGGLAYTVGTFFFHSRRIPYAHAIWHGFVLVGSACHFVALVQILPLVRA